MGAGASCRFPLPGVAGVAEDWSPALAAREEAARASSSSEEVAEAEAWKFQRERAALEVREVLEEQGAPAPSLSRA